MTGTEGGPIRRVGDFLILEEVGRGGMGIVYRAEQVSLGRIVALKVLPSLVGLDSGSVARFRREAEAASRISHPGIAPVHAVGEENGVHYFAMEFVEGPPLDRLLQTVGSRPAERLLGSLFEESGLDQAMPGVATADRRSSGIGSRYARSCARIAADVASALAAAHREGVIHRDVKPSNILVRANGQPVLVDFGLARDEQTLGLTRTGDAIGTPNYMAPEQACGGSRVDGRADVWGLGATLYEMLTLRPPFNGANAAEIMRRIVDDEPTPVRSLNPRVPEDLARIVETCLRKDPDARYAAVEALELDLRNYLADRPVLARRSGIAHRLGRFVARNRVSVAVGCAVFLASVGLYSVMGAVARRESSETGRHALDAASVAIAELRFEDAQAEYGKARAMLGEDAVRAARAEQIHAAFTSMYSAGRFAELGSYLDTWSETERSDDWHRMREQVEGRGTLDTSALPAGSRARLRAVDADGELGPWRELVAGDRLTLGAWLCEVEAPGRARVVHTLTVSRDQRSTLRPLLYELAGLPAGFDGKVVPDDTGSSASYVAKTELSNDELSQLLATQRGTALADEIRPKGWLGATPASAARLPVRGISWRQARVIAVLTGTHVMDRREFELAATAGILRLRHPFGSAMRWDLVAASQTGGLGAPMPVDSLGAGASPHGILHLVGNVRELLTPHARDQVLAIGGDYTCDQEPELCVDGSRALLELGVGTSDPRVGLRLARFLPTVESPAATSRAKAMLADMLGSTPLASEWRIERSGEVIHEIAVRGVHGEARAVVDVCLATPGFAQVESPEVRDGFGAPVQFDRVPRSIDVADLRIRLREPARAGEGYKFRLRTRLTPLDGLWAVGAEHRFVLPMRPHAGVRQAYVLRMPERAHVTEIEPEPSLRFFESGREVLVWDVTATTDARAVAGCASVRFRVDGALTDDWPSFRTGSDAMAQLCRAIGGLVPQEQLDRIFDEDFVLLPHGIGRKAMTSATGSDRDHFDLLAVDDVTAVGPVVAVRARVRWSSPPPAWGTQTAGELDVVVGDWPVVAFFRKHEFGLRALWFGPEPQSDLGTFSRGCYRYEPMDFRIDVPPGATLLRDRGQVAEVQVVLRSQVDALAGVSVLVLGYRASPGELDGDPVHRLTTGEAFSPRARLLRPSVGARARTDLTEWVFASPAGARRESWQRLDVDGGRWRFLMRCCARADSDLEAVALFDRPDVQAFFSQVRASIHLPGERSR